MSLRKGCKSRRSKTRCHETGYWQKKVPKGDRCPAGLERGPLKNKNRGRTLGMKTEFIPYGVCISIGQGEGDTNFNI